MLVRDAVRAIFDLMFSAGGPRLELDDFYVKVATKNRPNRTMCVEHHGGNELSLTFWTKPVTISESEIFRMFATHVRGSLQLRARAPKELAFKGVVSPDIGDDRMMSLSVRPESKDCPASYACLRLFCTRNGKAAGLKVPVKWFRIDTKSGKVETVD
jgi:hypothetical protein